MIALRHALLVALWLAVPSAALADAAARATDGGVLGVGDAQLTPRFWIQRVPDPDRQVLDRAQIQALNARVLKQDPSMHDLQQLPGRLPRQQVEPWIAALTRPPSRPLYDAQGQALSREMIEALLANAQLDALPGAVEPRFGLATRRTPMRGYPTALRAFSRIGDTDIDRFQETALFPGDAVAVVHTSRDGQWYFVVSQRYAAWVRAEDIAIGTRDDVLGYMRQTPWRVVTGARASTVFTPDAPALSQLPLDMGTRVPIDMRVGPADAVNGQAAYTSWAVRLPIRRSDGSLAFSTALIQRNQDTSSDDLPLTRANLLRQAFKFLGERYGWGHDFNGRDCSGFVSDVYRSFGVQLPRNTGDQATSPGLDHTTFDSAATHAQRMRAVDGLQPGDMVYIPGHVMMVIGRLGGQPYVIHDVHGVSYRDAAGTVRSLPLNAVSVTPLLPLMHADGTSFIDSMTSIVRIR